MGTADNVGIVRGMTALTGNASNPHVLFLERDFQLIEVRGAGGEGEGGGRCAQLGAAAQV